MWMRLVNKTVDNDSEPRPFCPLRTAIPTCGLHVDKPFNIPGGLPLACGHRQTPCGWDTGSCRIIHTHPQTNPTPSTSPQQPILPIGPTKSGSIHIIPSTDDDDYIYLYPSYLKQRDDDGRGYLPYCLTRHWQVQGGQS